MSGRYRDDPEDPARLDKHGRPEPTRRLGKDNWLYCTVWAEAAGAMGPSGFRVVASKTFRGGTS